LVQAIEAEAEAFLAPTGRMRMASERGRTHGASIGGHATIAPVAAQRLRKLGVKREAPAGEVNEGRAITPVQGQEPALT